jgi:hypothetical protein
VDLTIEDLLTAIHNVRMHGYDTVFGNIVEELGLGMSDEAYAQVHELIAKAFREGKIEYRGCGKYAPADLDY